MANKNTNLLINPLSIALGINADL